MKKKTLRCFLPDNTYKTIPLLDTDTAQDAVRVACKKAKFYGDPGAARNVLCPLCPCLFVSVSVSVPLSVPVPVSVSMYLSLTLSLSLSLCLCLYVSVSMSLSLSLCLCLYVSVSISLSVSATVSATVSASVSASVACAPCGTCLLCGGGGVWFGLINLDAETVADPLDRFNHHIQPGSLPDTHAPK